MSALDACSGAGRILAGLLLLVGCASEPTAPAPSEPAASVLNVGTSRTVPPIMFQQDGQTLGLEADLARKLAAELGMEARIVSMYWPNLIPELRAGRIDIIMAGMSVTQEREHQVAFADPYLLIGQSALIRAADKFSLGTKEQVLSTPQRVGVEVDSTGETFYTGQNPEADIRKFPTVLKAVEALIVGEVDVVVYDRPTLTWLAKEHPDDDLFVVPGLMTTEELAWAIRRGDREFLDQINAILAKWRQSGQLEEITSRWLSSP